jgi:hypothetical protein
VGGKVDGTTELVVDGQFVTRVTGFFGPPAGEIYWGADAAIPKATYCFNFEFFFGTKTTRDLNLSVTDQVITSFTTS